MKRKDKVRRWNWGHLSVFKSDGSLYYEKINVKFRFKPGYFYKYFVINLLINCFYLYEFHYF